MRLARLIWLACLLGVVPAAAHAQTEVVAEVRVHGNNLTPTDEVIALSGLVVGASFTENTLRDVESRLKGSRRFQSVEVLKRFASITDATRISVVIIVNDGAAQVVFDRMPDGEEVARIVRRGWSRRLMYLPILHGEDGYGLTYGLTTSLADVAGSRSRLSVPLSWGGTKRAAVVLEKNLATGPLSRVELGGAVQRRRHPTFDADDSRQKAWIRLERAERVLRVGATAAWDDVTFGAVTDGFATFGADVAVDTRLDPGYPRNAIWMSGGYEVLAFRDGHRVHRTRVDGRGYLGLIRESVLAVRVTRDGANGALPRYLQPLLGGWSSLRGFEAGRFHGDIAVSASAELLVPLTSPLKVGKFGVSVFTDTGAAYDHGLKLSDQTWHTGVGSSVWFTATGFRLTLSVARGRSERTRVNVGGGFTF